MSQTRGSGYWKLNNSLLTDEAFVDEIRVFIQEALRENDTNEISRALLFHTVLCMTRGKVIQYASRKKRLREERLKRLENIISVKSDANENDEQLQGAIEERNEIIEFRTKANMFRCKVNWAAYAEKSSAYLFSLEQRKARSRSIPSLFLHHVRDTGELSDSADQMLNECTAFYGQLYKRVPRPERETVSFLESIDAITEAQREECDMRFTEAELTAALSSMKLNTAPGPCGWTVEFFKTFWDIFCPLLLAVIAEIYERTLPDSF